MRIEPAISASPKKENMPTVEVIVLMGISGAGKNHFIDNRMPKPNLVVSADDFFMKEGKYVFDPKLLSQAHANCFRRTVDFLKEHRECDHDTTLVVNNTNTSVSEIAPYMAAAGAYGGEGHIICLRIDPVIAAGRNTHGTPLETIVKMAERMEKTLKDLPPWWDKEVFQWDPGTSSYRFA